MRGESSEYEVPEVVLERLVVQNSDFVFGSDGDHVVFVLHFNRINQVLRVDSLPDLGHVAVQFANVLVKDFVLVPEHRLNAK